MNECKKTTQHLQKYSSLACFCPLFRVILTCNWNEVLQKLFSSFCTFRGVSKHLPNKRQNALIMLQMNTSGTGPNAFCAGEEHLSAGDEMRWECAFKLQPPADTQLATSEFQTKIYRGDCYSPSKTGGSYHVLVLTSEYATPTSYMYMYIRNRALCWTKRPSSRLSW